MFNEIVNLVKRGRKVGEYYQYIFLTGYLIYDARCGLLALWSGSPKYTKDGFCGVLDCVIGFTDLIYEEEKLKLLYEDLKDKL